MNIITEVKKLDFPRGQYVVIGSGIMAQLGLREANDVDIAVAPDLYVKLRASGEWEEEERYGKIFLKKDAVEINPRLDWQSYSTTAEEAIASATIIDGVPFMNLNELVMFKRALGRAKDLADIVIIEEYLAGRAGSDHYLSLTVPHPDGKPKKTKFISSYDVLEHVDLKSLKRLYLVTSNGKALALSAQPYSVVSDPGKVRVYQEITPLTNLVASTLDERTFARYITSETKSKGCPKICFTEYEFNVEDFLSKNENREIMYSPIPETNPRRLWEYLSELKHTPNKKTKTISLNSSLKEASYRLIRHGFWFAAGDELLFFPIPSIEEMERDHYQWWKYVN